MAVKFTVQYMLRFYGDVAEAECDARASYCAMQGDKGGSSEWRRLKAIMK